MNKQLKVIVEGDLTAINNVKQLYSGNSNVEFCEGIFSKLINCHISKWDPHVLPEHDYYIVIDITNNLNEKNYRIYYLYRQLVAFFGNIHLVQGDYLSIVPQILLNGEKKFLIPCIDKMTKEDFEALPMVIEGESKIVRELNSMYHIVKYKPTIYSHKMQRAGVVEGSDLERMSMTRDILDLFSRHGIKHSYLYVGKEYILADALDNNTMIPPVEVIVKRCFVGSDKHRYYEMDKLKNRFGKEVVKEDKNEYQKLLVRFDYRNPNHHPVTGVPIGDIPLCDDLADEFINAEVAKMNAKKIFHVLDYHFTKMQIYFEDVCLMLTTDGDKLYGEVSQDCGRYKHMKEDGLTDLDKDVWRAGGSSELVLTKYRMISKIVHDYVLSLYN